MKKGDSGESKLLAPNPLVRKQGRQDPNPVLFLSRQVIKQAVTLCMTPCTWHNRLSSPSASPACPPVCGAWSFPGLPFRKAQVELNAECLCFCWIPPKWPQIKEIRWCLELSQVPKQQLWLQRIAKVAGNHPPLWQGVLVFFFPFSAKPWYLQQWTQKPGRKSSGYPGIFWGPEECQWETQHSCALGWPPV